MKKLITLMGLMLSFSAISSSLSVVKIDDGTWAYCRNKVDVWKFRHQAYSISEVSIDRDNEDLNLSMNIHMKQCVEKASGVFAFETKDPLEDYFYEVPWAMSGPNLVRNETKSINFQAHRDGIYQVLVKGALRPSLSDNTQIVKAKIPLSSLLNDEEKKVLFKDNGSVKVSYDFYLQRQVKTSSSNNPSYAPTRTINYGVFRFLLKLESIGSNEVIIGEVIRR